jgi:catechol 2,3-dioxygenase-like lactoylglutathione lyase family enzyme
LGESTVPEQQAREHAGAEKSIMARDAKEGDAMQIDHVAIPVSDLATSRAFYEPALASLGVQVVGERPGAVIFGGGEGQGMVGLRHGTEYRGPVHVALSMDRAGVDAFYKAALAAGGTDNGAPGLRDFAPNYYAAYVRDPDGNNIEAVCRRA